MKRTISIVITLILCVSLLVACGSNDTSGTAPSSSEAGSSPSAAESNISGSEAVSSTSAESPETQENSVTPVAGTGQHSFETINPADLEHSVAEGAPVVYLPLAPKA